MEFRHVMEGYYLSADQIQKEESGTNTLTGADAHASVEVYFDGVGWLPLDTTPGYYYDAVSLQQMISAPDQYPALGECGTGRSVI